MTSQLTFEDARYPIAPGSKRDGTSRAAAPTQSEAATLRRQVADVLCKGDWTADEIAGVLGKSILSVRPRLSELLRLGRIKETDQRRKNESGKSATVWRLVA